MIEKERDVQKIATITDVGVARFHEMMNEPVETNAHTEDIYQMKLDALRFVEQSVKQEVLRSYEAWHQTLLTEAETTLMRIPTFDSMTDEDKRSALRMTNLKKLLNTTTIDWIKQTAKDLKIND
jgi:hypothetical protein